MQPHKLHLVKCFSREIYFANTKDKRGKLRWPFATIYFGFVNFPQIIERTKFILLSSQGSAFCVLCLWNLIYELCGFPQFVVFGHFESTFFCLSFLNPIIHLPFWSVLVIGMMLRNHNKFFLVSVIRFSTRNRKSPKNRKFWHTLLRCIWFMRSSQITLNIIQFRNLI